MLSKIRSRGFFKIRFKRRTKNFLVHNNSNPHEKILSKLRVSGEQRMEQKLLVAANGVTNTRVENLNFNFNNTNPSKYNLLNI
jgi:hypothetical protein